MRSALWTWAATTAVLGLFAIPAHADVELGDPATPPPPAPTPYEVQPEVIDGPPPGLHSHELFGGARMGPYPRFGVELRVLAGSFDSDVEVESRGGLGNRIDVTKDLPFDDDISGTELSGWVQLSSLLVLNGGYLRLAGEERGVMKRPRIHDAVPFEAGAPVKVTVEAQMAWLGARLLAIDAPNLKFGIPFGGLWTAERVTIRDRVGGRRAGKRIDAFSPYVGLFVDLQLGYGIGIESELRFFAWGEDSDTAFGFIDARAELYLTLMDHVRLYAGFRGIAVDYEEFGTNDLRFSWSMGGLSTGVSIYF